MKRLFFFILLVPIIFLAAYVSESGVDIPNTAEQPTEIQEHTKDVSTSTMIDTIKHNAQETGKEIVKDAIKETLQEKLQNP